MKPTYNPEEYEDKIYKDWEESGYFNPDNLESKKDETFSAAMAPVNVTGSLHMGHALENTLIDILIRKKRMQGFKTLWFPGTDHAGIATEVKVEQKLQKEGKSKKDIGREEFIKEAWKWKEKYGGIILKQFRKLGVSCDWSRERFTLDDKYNEAVKAAFNHYENKGWIYKGDRLINWCPRCKTALSDLEVKKRETKGKLWFIKYPLKEKVKIKGKEIKSITIATTRPETMLGDTAVAFHPGDERYENLKGKKVILPLVGRELPIISDHRVDPEFGTGFLKVTPAHDNADWEIGREHDLEVINVINFEGEMTEEAGEYEGLAVGEARKKIVQKLKEENYLEKIENYTYQKNICDRCENPVEPLISKQWFLKMNKLAEKAKEAVKADKVEILPEKWEKPYFDWLNNIRDWCLSRQIWWGHKIPIEGEKDVLDTWFSSALWPFAALGWPQNCQEIEEGRCKDPKGDLKEFYPTNVITSAKGILYLWQVRMIFSGMEFMGKRPFNKVYIHPMVLTEDGKRMSKSLGTGVDPLELIEEYGADATRFGLAWQTTGVQSIKFSEDSIATGEKFGNKIWNASRYIKMRLGDKEFDKNEIYNIEKKKLSNEDKEILNKLTQLKKNYEENLESFRFGQACEELYHFFWDDFCEIYLEASKGKDDENTEKILLLVLSESLKLIHPVMPFITEVIWRKLPLKNKKKFLMIEDWPDIEV